MTLTNSRAFDTNGKQSLKLLLVKSPDQQYYAPIDHPCVMGYLPMTALDKNQANSEYLGAIKKDFWKQVPEIPKNTITDTVTVRNDFSKIPASDWVALIKLYAAFCGDASKGQDLEVGGLIICNRETKELRVVIPEQKVTKASVDWSITGANIKDTKKIYFLDGTELAYGELKEKWDFIGMTHSHNTMFTSPSGVDDQFEVGTPAKPLPTGIHILVGSFKKFKEYEYVEPTYEVYPSVSHGGRRYKIQDLSELVDSPNDEEYVAYTFDETLLEVITPATTTWQKPITITPQKGSYSKYSRQLGLLEDEFTAIEQLAPGRKKGPEASAFIVRATTSLLAEVLTFMGDDLNIEPEEILQTVMDNVLLEDDEIYGDVVEEKTKENGFFAPFGPFSENDFKDMPVGFSDPFYVGE